MRFLKGIVRSLFYWVSLPMTSKRLLIAFAAINLSIAVAVGAMESHLGASLSAEDIHRITIARTYQTWNAIGLIAMLAIPRDYINARLGGISAWLIASGIVMFSGGLYFLALTGSHEIAFVTPFGGGALILGWAVLAAAGLRGNRSR